LANQLVQPRIGGQQPVAVPAAAEHVRLDTRRPVFVEVVAGVALRRRQSLFPDGRIRVLHGLPVIGIDRVDGAAHDAVLAAGAAGSFEPVTALRDHDRADLTMDAH
jgi:hypothetical protein